jgi:hypothetical protein
MNIIYNAILALLMLLLSIFYLDFYIIKLIKIILQTCTLTMQKRKFRTTEKCQERNPDVSRKLYAHEFWITASYPNVSKSLHAISAVDKVALGQALLQILQFSPVNSIILPMLHTNLHLRVAPTKWINSRSLRTFPKAMLRTLWGTRKVLSLYSPPPPPFKDLTAISHSTLVFNDTV